MSRLPPEYSPTAIIDAHTHCYVGWIDSPEAFARQHQESHWAALHASADSLQTWPSPDQWSRTLIDAEVSAAVIQGWYWEQPSTCILANRALRQFCEQTTFPVYPFASIHPGLEPAALRAELEFCAQSGFCGIGEIHPTVQECPLDAPAWEPIFAFAEKHQWPVTIHVSEPLGRPHPGNIPTPLQPILHVVERHPDLILILAHWGGLACFHELNPYVRRRFRNVFYDTAATTLLYDEAIWSAVLRAVPASKLLFGTDYPLKPARNTDDSAPSAIRAEALRQLPPGQVTAVLYENARSILEAALR